jgi:glycosyltransferase involved in cell wall biosynthesis
MGRASGRRVNIWYVQPTAGGPGLGRQWRAYWLAHYWQQAGHQVTVVSAGYHHLMDGGPRPEGSEVIGGVRYWFAQVPGYEGNGLARVRNMLALGPRLRRTAARIEAAAGRPDVVIASSPHIFAVHDCMALASRLGARFWFEVRDVWPETLVALNQAGRFNPLVLWAAWVERRAYRRADKVVSALAAAEPHMLARGLAPGRFVWAPNGVSEEEIAQALAGPPQADPHPLVRQVEQAATEGVFTVVYAGAMGPPQHLEQLLDAFELLQRRGARAHLLLVGSGVSRESITERIRATGLRNAEVAGPVPKAVVGSLLRACGAAVLSLRANHLWRHGLSPNKLFDYCLYAPRVIATVEASALAGLEDLPIVRTPPGDAAALADLVQRLAAQPRVAPDPQVAVRALQRFRLREVALRVVAQP